MMERLRNMAVMAIIIPVVFTAATLVIVLAASFISWTWQLDPRWPELIRLNLLVAAVGAGCGALIPTESRR